MRIVPAVGFSRPAIMRSAVVLPHPEEPTRIMNSPSAMSRVSSSTATVPPANCLLTASSVTLGMHPP
jgi:hypothetical protein